MITLQQSYWLLGPGFSQNVYRITAVPMKQKKFSRQNRDTRFAKNVDDMVFVCIIRLFHFNLSKIQILFLSRHGLSNVDRILVRQIVFASAAND